MTKSFTLTVFLPRRTSLQTWSETGTFDRELAIYLKLQKKGVNIQFVSYAGREEYDFLPQINGMKILCNWIGWSEKRYYNRMHQLHGFRLWQSKLYKTDQLNGSEVAVKASKLWKRPLIVRFGYLWSAFEMANRSPDAPFVKSVIRIQDRAFQQAQHVVMTSQMMLDDVQNTHPDIGKKTTIIPNYVDMDTFYPSPQPKLYDLVYVGRIAHIKNLRNLFWAIQNSNYTLAIIGDGIMMEELQSEFGDLDGKLKWMGRKTNAELPALIQESRAYILPSLSEGHPKSLIEAMACGMPVIGTPVQGIKHVIQHKDNGYLSEGTDAESILKAIDNVLSSPDMMNQMGKHARQFAIDNYSLDMIAEKEYKLLSSMI